MRVGHLGGSENDELKSSLRFGESTLALDVSKSLRSFV